MVNYLVFKSKDVDYILIVVYNGSDLPQIQEEFARKKYTIWSTEGWGDNFIIKASRSAFDEEEE